MTAFAPPRGFGPMEMSTNQNGVDVNPNSPLKELQSTSSFWSPLKAIPISSFYKLHRVPSSTQMAEAEPAGTNGDVLSSPPTEPSISSRSVGLVSPNGTALPHSKPFVEAIPDEQILPDKVELPPGDSLGGSVREEHIPPNGIHNKLLEQVIRTPGRQPSPLPTHLSIPGPSHYRVLREEGSGYVAPRFEGKEQQMEQGTFFLAVSLVGGLTQFF